LEGFHGSSFRFSEMDLSEYSLKALMAGDMKIVTVDGEREVYVLNYSL
jgi:hypothetical protein